MRLVPVIKSLICGSLYLAAIQYGHGNVARADDLTAVIVKGGTFACRNWAAWHDFTLASLTSAGASYGRGCPIRLKGGSKVEIVEDDAGAGASVVRSHGKEWYVDNQALEGVTK
jgi:hypothetical protein